MNKHCLALMRNILVKGERDGKVSSTFHSDTVSSRDRENLSYLIGEHELRNIEDLKDFDDLMGWYQQRKISIHTERLDLKKIELEGFDLPFNKEAHADLIRSLEEDKALSYENLYECFVPAASPHQEFRDSTNIKLKETSTHPHFPFALLRVIACPERSSPRYDKIVCKAATRSLNDYFICHELSKIPSEEKDYLKTLIFCLMLCPPFPCIDSMLDGALDVLCNGRKQEPWHRLFWVPISTLNLEDPHNSLTKSLIDAAKSLIGNFQQHRDRTSLFFDALHGCTYEMQRLVLDIFHKTAVPIQNRASNDITTDHHSLLYIQCCRILSLSHRMLMSQEYLVHRYPPLKEELTCQGDGLATIDKLRFAVCENIALVLMNDNQEPYCIYDSWDHELELYIISSVIFLLKKLSASTSASCDQLIVSALNCLMKSTFDDFMKWPVFREIVIPNVRLRDEDERLFKDNYLEFIQSDMHASDSHTRRGIACNILKKLVMKAEEEFATMLSEEITNMLKSVDWKSKECAIRLVVFLMAEDAEGNSILSEMEKLGHNLINLYSVFNSVIEPELTSNDENELPMLKAAALKFLKKLLEPEYYTRDVVHSIFPESLTRDLVHSVIRFLRSKSRVVEKYALDSALVLLEKFPASHELEKLADEVFISQI